MGLARATLALLALLLWLATVRATDPPTSSSPPSQSSARQLLRAAIEPIVDLFAHPDGPARAWVLRVHLVDSDVHPPELRGSVLGVRLEVAPESRIITRYAALGTVVTICRQGQTAWATPASKLAPLLAKVEAKPPTAADRKPISPLRLDMPEPLFWVGFYFFGIQDRGTETIDGNATRRLEFAPPDEHGKEREGKHFRVFIREDNHQFTRLVSSDASGKSTYAVDENRVLASLPDSEFLPPADNRAEVLQIPIERFRPFVKVLREEEEERRKEVRERRGN